MWVIWTGVTVSAALRFFGGFRRKIMRGVATGTLFFHHMASLAEGRANFLRNTQVLSLDSHSVKRDRMAALTELLQLLGMALPTLIGKNHGFWPVGRLVVRMTGDAIDPFLGMPGLHPSLKKGGSSFYVAAHAVSRVDPIFRFLGRRACTSDQY